jgi:serine/threonine-protein kinase
MIPRFYGRRMTVEFYIPTEDQIRELFPAYQHVVFLRKGGFKAVYEVQHQDGTREALKLAYVPPPEIFEQGQQVEELNEVVKRLRREIMSLGNCQSPYIVKLGSLKPVSVQINHSNYIAYSEEFLVGEDLDRLIRGGQRPTEPELRLLASCLFKAIQDLWSNAKVVHRDIKPQNVIKTGNTRRQFVLLDLGLAYSLRESGITRDPAAIPGTLLYIAPEMLRPNFREALDFRSDLYTAALTMYEYATGVNPFRTKPGTAGQTLYRILRERPQPILQLRPDLSSRIGEVIEHLLKKIPALRPSNLVRLISLMEEGI